MRLIATGSKVSPISFRFGTRTVFFDLVFQYIQLFSTMVVVVSYSGVIGGHCTSVFCAFAMDRHDLG